MAKRKAPKALARTPTETKVADIAILGGPTEDGQGAKLLRVRDGNVTTGEIRPAREGQPVTAGELVRLRPIDAEQRICEVEVLHAPAASEPASEAAPQALSRPARVSNDRYRKNWSAIFTSKRTKGNWSLN